MQYYIYAVLYICSIIYMQYYIFEINFYSVFFVFYLPESPSTTKVFPDKSSFTSS